MKHINIEQFSNGELTQQINRELEAVARNIADPNTDAKATRKITVSIVMKPNEKETLLPPVLQQNPPWLRPLEQ